ncbi:MAG: outer membrane beta-barrel protein [Gemmatimonadaceae bacterium]
MKRVIVAVATLAFASTLGAQGAMMSPAGGGVSFTVGGGASFPTSDFKGNSTDGGTNTGWNVLGGVGFNLPSIPVGLRAEVMYQRFGIKGGGDGNANILTGGLNGILQVPVMEGSGVSPYVTAGIGWGRTQVSFNTTTLLDSRIPSGARGSLAVAATTASVSESGFMYNAGAGVKFSLASFDAFVEARYMAVASDKNDFVKGTSVPVFFGLTFRP